MRITPWRKLKLVADEGWKMNIIVMRKMMPTFMGCNLDYIIFHGEFKKLGLSAEDKATAVSGESCRGVE